MFLFLISEKLVKSMHHLQEVHRHCSCKTFWSTFLVLLFERACCFYVPLQAKKAVTTTATTTVHYPTITTNNLLTPPTMTTKNPPQTLSQPLQRTDLSIAITLEGSQDQEVERKLERNRDSVTNKTTAKKVYTRSNLVLVFYKFGSCGSDYEREVSQNNKVLFCNTFSINIYFLCKPSVPEMENLFL